MVDISDKLPSQRIASASVEVVLNEESWAALLENRTRKGNVVAAARIAGIQAAKKTSELIPLCHQIPLSNVSIEIATEENIRTVRITSRVSAAYKTGVEMEALVACSVAALTVYDMLKAVQKDIVITNLMLLEKHGGSSGNYRREDS